MLGDAALRAGDLARAAAQVSQPGALVCFLGAIAIPEEETCFFTYTAPAAPGQASLPPGGRVPAACPAGVVPGGGARMGLWRRVRGRCLRGSRWGGRRSWAWWRGS